MLTINEIFSSIQGESSYAGLPCTFVRLTYCNLRCSYCDTEYAFTEGSEISLEQAIQQIETYGNKLIEITGGEPLLQPECLPLMDRLVSLNYTVLLETSGSITIENVNPLVNIIMDLKCPSSGMGKKNRFENLALLKQTDEIKFVIGCREDYDWAKDMISRHRLDEKARLLFSCVFNKLAPEELAAWILTDKLQVRFQLQLHKYIWDPNKRGV